MNTSDLQNIDLEETPAPRGLKVEIEGYEPIVTDLLPQSSLLAALVHAYVVRTMTPVRSVFDFKQRVIVLAIDQPKRYIKVRIA